MTRRVIPSQVTASRIRNISNHFVKFLLSIKNPPSATPLVRALALLVLSLVGSAKEATARQITAQSSSSGQQTAAELISSGDQLLLAGDQAGASTKWDKALILCRDQNLKHCEFIAKGRLIVLDVLQGKEEVAHKAEVSLLESVHREGFRETEFEILQAFGQGQFLSGAPENAKKYFQASLAIAELLGDSQKQLGSRELLAAAEEALGKLDVAVALQSEVLTLARKLSDRSVEAVALGKLSQLYLQLGKTEESEKSIREALRIDESLGNDQLNAAHFVFLGNISSARGKPKDAVDDFSKAIGLYRKTGDLLQTVYALTLLGKAYAANGNKKEALDSLQEGMELADRSKLTVAQGAVFEAQASVYETFKDYKSAREAWRSTLTLAQKLSSTSTYVALACLGITRTSLSMKDYEAVTEFGVIALSKYQALGNEAGVSQAFSLLLQLVERSGNGSAILSALLVASERARKNGNQKQLGLLLLAASRVQSFLGNSAAGLTYAREAKEIFRTLNDNSLIVDGAVAESEMLGNTGDRESALRSLQAVRELTERLDSPETQAHYFTLLTGLLSALGKYEEALVEARRALEFSIKAQDKMIEGAIFAHLSRIYQNLSQKSEALNNAQKAAEIFKSQGSLIFEANAEITWGFALQRFGDHELSIQHFQRAYDLALGLGNLGLTGEVLQDLALATSLGGDISKSREYMQQVEKLYESQNDSLRLGASEFAFGTILVGREPAEALKHFLRAIEIGSKSGNHTLVIRASIMAAATAQSVGDMKGAKQLLVDVSRIVEEKGTVGDRLQLLIAEAGLYRKLGDTSAGIESAQQAADLAAKNQRREDEYQALDLLSGLYQDTGEYQHALAVSLRALEVLRKAQLGASEVMALSAISKLYSHLGESHKSAEAAMEAIELARKSGYKALEISGLMVLAESYAAVNETEQALRVDEEALEVATSLGPSEFIQGVQLQLSNRYRSLGLKKEAYDHAVEGLRASEQTSNLEYIFFSILQVAARARDFGLYEQAWKYLGRATEAAERLYRAKYQSMVLAEKVLLNLAQHQFEEAERNSQKALEIANRSGDVQTALLQLRELGAIAVEQSKYEKGLPYLLRAREIAQDHGAQNDLYEIYGLLGAVYSSLGRYEDGYAHLKQADGFLEEMWTRATKQAKPSHFFQDKVPIYVDLVRTAYELYSHHDRDQKYAEEAFVYSEKSRGRNLSVVFSKANVESTDLQIPASIRSDEQAVANTFRAAEARYSEALAQTRAPEDLVSRRREAYRQAITAQSLFIDSLRKKYPLYANLKYPKAVSAGDIPLKKNDILLEYFVTDREIFRWEVRVRRVSTSLRQVLTEFSEFFMCFEPAC